MERVGLLLAKTIALALVGAGAATTPDADTATSTTSVQTTVNLVTTKNAADVVGVSTNSEGDLDALLVALGVNSLIVIGCTVTFSVLRLRFPLVYSGGAGSERFASGDSLWSWVKASVTLSTEERIEVVGLDNALLIEFTRVCMRILLMAGTPLVLVLLPLHYLFGDGGDQVDSLSKLEMGNVRSQSEQQEGHPWLYYVHAIAAWGVCLVAHTEVYRAQSMFLRQRFQWLKRLPFPRCATLLVEAIPYNYQSDAKLHDFFSAAFSAGSVKEAHVVRVAKDLAAMFGQREVSREKLRKAELQFDKTGDRPMVRPKIFRGSGAQVDAIEFYASDIASLDERIKEERASVQKEAESVGGVNGHCGFVTFSRRREAEMALNARFSASSHAWKVSVPPDPSDILWKDLKHKHVEANLLRELIGYMCIAGLFVGFMPICIFVTNIARAFEAPGPLQPIWAAFAPTLGLVLFLSFLPSALLFIFRQFFLLKADAWSQSRLQIWYFWFQVLYVILVTTVGGSLFNRAKDLADNPSSMFDLLGVMLPQASHFYMNYLVLQWTTHATNMIRKTNLIKFLMFRAIYDEKEAHKLSEPEDQDYMGLGSRSARFTINMLIGIIFSSISPLVAVLAFVNFALCRLFYGYLTVFSETRKPDLGGVFWVSQLRHLQIGVMIYSVLTIGVLKMRAKDIYPMCIAGPTLLFSIWSFWNFRWRFEWEKLPLDQIVFDEGQGSQEAACGVYVQPELQEETEAAIDPIQPYPQPQNEAV